MAGREGYRTVVRGRIAGGLGVENVTAGLECGDKEGSIAGAEYCLARTVLAVLQDQTSVRLREQASREADRALNGGAVRRRPVCEGRKSHAKTDEEKCGEDFADLIKGHG